MADVPLDDDTFFRRMKLLYTAWTKENVSTDVGVYSLSKMDCLVSAVGKYENINSKSMALQTWLLNRIIPDTIMILSEKCIWFLSSKKNIKWLRELENRNPDYTEVPPVKLFVQNKDDKDEANVTKLIKIIKGSKKGKIIGVFSQEICDDSFVIAGKAALELKHFKKIDVSVAVAYIMCPKDDVELWRIQRACKVTIHVFHELLHHIMKIVNDHEKIEHLQLSRRVQSITDIERIKSRIDLSSKSLCYPAIIQSGGNYSLKFNVDSDQNYLHFGVIICSFGVQYKDYCSNIVRTLLVNPTNAIVDNYNFLLKLEEKILKKLVAGKKISKVYESGVKFIKLEKPSLVTHLTQDFGFAIGIEFGDRSLVIGPETDLLLKEKMVFNVNIGLSNLINSEATDEKAKVYALFIGDTVIVNADGKPATVLTTCNKMVEDIRIIQKEEEEEKQKQSEENKFDEVHVDEEAESKEKNQKLNKLYFKPNIETESITGDLKARTSSLCYKSPVRGHKIDILYDNIKKAFFQLRNNEKIILLHFHLKHAIMFGKTELVDVQFYAKFDEITTDLGKHQHMLDPDDITAKESEHKLRLKTAFESFYKKVEDVSKQKIKFDIPLMDLEISGMVYKESVTFQRTSDCLVDLNMPIIIILEDVEAVLFKLFLNTFNSFTMIVVFKDYHRMTMQVDGVPGNKLNDITSFLSSSKVKYYEDDLTDIMKTLGEATEERSSRSSPS
ncbi:hypothetical protein PV326_013050 [Microctonus aethiopoides]|nr:hypothetical protein PV326_013050 [Microctonus aethiopoides]